MKIINLQCIGSMIGLHKCAGSCIMVQLGTILTSFFAKHGGSQATTHLHVHYTFVMSLQTYETKLFEVTEYFWHHPSRQLFSFIAAVQFRRDSVDCVLDGDLATEQLLR